MKLQWTGENIADLMQFMHPAKPVYMAGFANADDIIGVNTPHGLQFANKGDWIEKDDGGNLSIRQDSI
jgi:hypothetical protein